MDAIEQLIFTVRQSPKYAQVNEDVVRRIGLRELQARRNVKEAADATKGKLHQIAGAYLESKPRYRAWHDDLRTARQSGASAFQEACQALLRRHASTRERAAFHAELYAVALRSLPPLGSVLDVGCGLNPLALPWLPLASQATYHACDIHADMMAFLNQCFALAGWQAQAECRDALSEAALPRADLALLLKVLPVLEQQDKASSLRLLRALDARYLLVSFPTRSLGGRGKGMAQHYEARFLELIQAEAWTTARFEFATELCFLVTK